MRSDPRKCLKQKVNTVELGSNSALDVGFGPEKDAYKGGSVTGSFRAYGIPTQSMGTRRIYYLAVAPEYQQRGYGERIMQHVEDSLVAMGCPKLNIAVHSNAKVLAFYHRLGYAIDEVVSMDKSSFGIHKPADTPRSRRGRPAGRPSLRRALRRSYTLRNHSWPFSNLSASSFK